MEKQILQLKNLIENSKYTVAITGAGISTSVGINDMEHLNVMQTMQTSLAPMVRARPEHSYKLLRKSFLKAMFETGASITHKCLVALENQGLLQGIITTNVDHLHTIAGSQNVAEIQGSYAINKCLSCGQHYDDVNIWNQGKAPRCQVCNGVIVSFPVYTHIGMFESDYQKAKEWISRADLVIVIGSKGMYGGYLDYINPNATIAQINPQKTQFNSIAELNIEEKSDIVFESLIQL